MYNIVFHKETARGTPYYILYLLLSMHETLNEFPKRIYILGTLENFNKTTDQYKAIIEDKKNFSVLLFLLNIKTICYNRIGKLFI